MRNSTLESALMRGKSAFGTLVTGVLDVSESCPQEMPVANRESRTTCFRTMNSPFQIWSHKCLSKAERTSLDAEQHYSVLRDGGGEAVAGYRNVRMFPEVAS